MSMKILLLADAGSTHTVKWAKSLIEHGFQITLFSLSPAPEELYPSSCKIYSLELQTKKGARPLSKFRYFRAIPVIKKIIRDFQPDVVHAHYASSYGLLGSLAGFHPFYVSVWGSDVFDFPRRSSLNKALLTFVFRKADRLFSTSQVMAKEGSRYTEKQFTVIPFGVDVDMFSPGPSQISRDEDTVIIGTVKALEEKYGMVDLVNGFARTCQKLSSKKMLLYLVGKGPLEYELRKLVKELAIEEKVIFTGWQEMKKVAEYHRLFDVSVFPSTCEESFGVSVVEGSATAKPVVVTRRGGLVEVVIENETGLVVPLADPEAIAKSLERLILDPVLRSSLGTAGRKRVIEFYDWNKNVMVMKSEYLKVKQS